MSEITSGLFLISPGKVVKDITDSLIGHNRLLLPTVELKQFNLGLQKNVED